MERNKIIEVFFDNDDKICIKVGEMNVNYLRGSEKIAFEFDKDFLRSNLLMDFYDVDLYAILGRQYLPSNKVMYGIFSDSAPDRWGRVLMKRREVDLAQREDRDERKLYESDFLLGVYDDARMGALRFKLKGEETYSSSNKEYSTPPFESLRELEEASRNFEDELPSDKWLDILLAPGSSLGGARPKATVMDEKGELWIAKFPSKNDTNDVGAWEKVAHDLARLCELNVGSTKAVKFLRDKTTFLTKRFDREGKKRIQFMSAMTAVGKVDGEEASYIDILSFILAYGKQPKKDATELWKRIVFNMAISNTDDHLRNHAFIYNNGWELSPLYDVNPVPNSKSLALNVNETDNRISLELALGVAREFGIERDVAKRTAMYIIDTVDKNWERLAKENGLSNSSINDMRSAFSSLSKSKIDEMRKKFKSESEPDLTEYTEESVQNKSKTNANDDDENGRG